MTTATHFFILAVPGRHGAGRHPGAQPVALRQPDPAAASRASSSASSRVREVRRHLRARSSSRWSILLTGSSRAAILSIILFFIAGGWLLARVNVAQGQAEARAAELRLEAA